MKADTKNILIPLLISGILSIPATFQQTRSGSFLFASIFTFLLVLGGYLVSETKGKKIPQILISFILGVIISEILFIAYWGVTHNFNYDKGIIFYAYIGALEVGFLSVIGVVSLMILKLLKI